MADFLEPAGLRLKAAAPRIAEAMPFLPRAASAAEKAVPDSRERTFAAAKPVPAVRMALIGGYTPRRCGIATFTADIYASLRAAAPDLAIDVYAMTPAADHTRFDAAVSGMIVESDPASYAAAARQIDESAAEVVWLQHEFGLFGGPAGDMILELVERIAAPLIITLHTVIPDPDPDQLRVMRQLIARASKLVVMSERARQLLLGSTYRADSQQIVLIPHGVPDRPFGRSRQFKVRFDFADRPILLTFGLLSPGKGIETVINALPAIAAEHPDLLYCIVGVTHPNLLEREGEAYRRRLQQLAALLGVERNIRWIDDFVETEELLDLIEAADIYVTPYPGAAQSTSGTLSYALALGKAVVSTPYAHAAELLADDRGVLVPFNDSAAIGREIGILLGDPDRILKLQMRAYEHGRAMIWPEFAARSLAAVRAVRSKTIGPRLFQPIGITGLLRQCDDTGILQHSVHDVPDRAHGYCVDDNARGLMLANRLGAETEPHRGRLAHLFAAFVQHAWNDATGQFRNFMGFDRTWLEATGSEDSCGRTLWALGATALEGMTPGLRRWARGLFETAAASASGFGSPRATAFAMLGADSLLASDPGHAPAKAILTQGAERLLDLFGRVCRPDWPWFETMLAYDNCRLSEAMIKAGERMARPEFGECGMASLDWIIGLQTGPRGKFRPVGSESFGYDFAQPRPFDQQPVEVWSAVDACCAAFAASGDAKWLSHARRAYAWFDGGNDRNLSVGDPRTGTCRDGINPRGVNLNEGAESILAYQLATCTIRGLPPGQA